MKLKLKLEDLSVDSFVTVRSGKDRGTVFGEQCTCWTRCGQNTCPGCPTCGNTCDHGDTCADSCAYTCVYTCDDASCANTCAYTCDDASCAGTCADCNASLYCDTNQPCPTAAYSHCAGMQCW